MRGGGRQAVGAVVGVDTGGTFTDFFVVDRRGLRVHKVPSTPHDPAVAVLRGLHELFPDDVPARVTYGSTVATNALLERRGARVCLVTTAGFEDVVEIGRQARPDLYALEPRLPVPLVTRANRIGVRERSTFDGKVLVPLTRPALRRLVRSVRARRPQSIAVALLHSYAAPRHERAVGDALAALTVPITLSHAIAREHREYERTSTAVVNAYVAPIMGRHLDRLAAALPGRRLRVMQSSGGVASAALVRREPVRTILSGPAGGVVGAARVVARAAIARAVTIDMGGTSTDVALIDGDVPHRSEWSLDGIAVRVPVIDIHTVGAGGGSIARLDAGGSLRVGPESAGADPGPACYGRGSAATVTDANVVLGRLDAGAFLGGRMQLDTGRAATAVDRLAHRLRMSRVRAAAGIVEVANAAMARAMRVISVERGHDPRDFVLVAFGGAAGVHACELALALGMRDVMIPRHPGLLSAIGMAEAPIARDYTLTVRRVGPAAEELRRMLAPLVRRGTGELRREGARDATVTAVVQMRYLGQAHELEVPLVGDYRRRFDAAHLRSYGHAAPERPVEVLALRLTVSSAVAAPRRRRSTDRRGRVRAGAPHRVWWRGSWLDAVRWDRDALAPGDRIDGPALVVEYSSTTLVPPDWRGVVDRDRNLRLVRRDARAPALPLAVLTRPHGKSHRGRLVAR